MNGDRAGVFRAKAFGVDDGRAVMLRSGPRTPGLSPIEFGDQCGAVFLTRFVVRYQPPAPDSGRGLVSEQPAQCVLPGIAVSAALYAQNNNIWGFFFPLFY